MAIEEVNFHRRYQLLIRDLLCPDCDGMRVPHCITCLQRGIPPIPKSEVSSTRKTEQSSLIKRDIMYPVIALCTDCQAFYTSDEFKPSFKIYTTMELQKDLLKSADGCDLCNGTYIPPIPMSEVK